MLVAFCAGCHRENEKVSQALGEVLSSDTTSATTVCGYTVSSLSNVRIEALRTDGSETEGRGTARITGTPVGYTERTNAGPCSAAVSFRYALATTRRRMMIAPNGVQRRTEEQVMRISELSATGR